MIIYKYVVHVLDKESNTVILNDFEGRANQESEKFLCKAIKKVLKDSKTKKLRFKNYNENYIKESCEDSIYNPENFILNSKIIAELFFEFINQNSEFNSSDIIIALININDQKMLVILNIEFKSNYTHIVQFLDNKFSVNMIENNNILTESKINNAAIINLAGANDEYHLKAFTSNEKFIDNFLDAVIIEDDKYKTQLFESITSQNLKTYATDVKQVIDTISYRNYLVRERTHINIHNFLEEIEEAGANAITKKILETNFENTNLEEFEIDKKYIEKAIRNMRIKTDTGFEIKCKSLDLEDPLKFRLSQNENGNYDLVLKNISSII